MIYDARTFWIINSKMFGFIFIKGGELKKQ